MLAVPLSRRNVPQYPVVRSWVSPNMLPVRRRGPALPAAPDSAPGPQRGRQSFPAGKLRGKYNFAFAIRANPA